MWRWVVALLVVLMPMGLPVFAQPTLSIDTAEVNIWPEYDREGVFVFYRITLSPDVQLPASISLRIPRSANSPSAVQMQDWDGLLYDLKYSIEAQGDWLLVRFTSPRPHVWLEYNDPRLKIDNQQRQFKFVWPGDYAVNQMKLRILQPANATHMSFTPGVGSESVLEDGNLFYVKQVDQVPAGATVTIDVTYQKPDQTFAATALPVYPVQPITPRTAGRLSRDMVGWVLGILGTLLIVGGIFWFLHSGRSLPETIRKQNGGAAKKEAHVIPESPENAIYCRQCGRRASPGDTFCRTCGTKIN